MLDISEMQLYRATNYTARVIRFTGPGDCDVIEFDRIRQRYYIPTRRGNVTVELGDYIVFDDDHHPTVMMPLEFFHKLQLDQIMLGPLHVPNTLYGPNGENGTATTGSPIIPSTPGFCDIHGAHESAH